MRAVGEGVGISVFCHFWKYEALRAVAGGVKVAISSHFWENEPLRALGERREIPGMAGWLAGWLAGLAGWLAGLAGWLAGWAICHYCVICPLGIYIYIYN